MKNAEEIAAVRDILLEQAEAVTIARIAAMLLGMADTLAWVLEDPNELQATLDDYHRCKEQERHE